MDIHQLFKVQHIIETQIVKFSGLKEDSLGVIDTNELRFLALLVKVGELANLTKCYKYARIKGNIDKTKAMILYVDALKFLLSIGNAYDVIITDEKSFSSVKKEKNPARLFSLIFDDIVTLKKAALNSSMLDSMLLYMRLFARFVNLGEVLGFRFDEIYNFYMKQAKASS